jgi:hypothetical protein
MTNLRVHFVAASIYMLVSGETGLARFLGWTVMLIGVTYPSLIVAMRSESRDLCSTWLRRLAAAGR